MDSTLNNIPDIIIAIAAVLGLLWAVMMFLMPFCVFWISRDVNRIAEAMSRQSREAEPAPAEREASAETG